MKKIALPLVLVILVSPLVSAQEVEPTNPGVKPGNPAYILDTGLDQARYQISRIMGDQAQARVGLKIARERLAEAEELEEENKEQLAEKARKRVRDRVRDLERIRDRQEEKANKPEWTDDLDNNINRIKQKQDNPGRCFIPEGCG